MLFYARHKIQNRLSGLDVEFSTLVVVIKLQHCSHPEIGVIANYSICIVHCRLELPLLDYNDCEILHRCFTYCLKYATLLIRVFYIIEVHQTF